MLKLFASLFSEIKKSFVLFLVYRFLSLFFHVKGVALVIAYVNLMLGHASPIPVIDDVFLNFRTAFVFSLPCLAGAMVLLGAYLSYRARLVSVRMVVSRERRSLEELLLAVDSADYIHADSHLTEAELLRVASRDTRYYARLLASLMEAFVPLIIIFALVCFLGYLQPVLTVIVLVALGGYGAMLLRISRKTALLTNAMNRSAPLDLKTRRLLIKSAMSANSRRINEAAYVYSHDNSPVEDFLDVYSQRLSVNDRTMVYTFGFLASLMVCIVSYIGIKIDSGVNPLSNAVLFVVVLNAALMQLRGVNTASTKVRFYQPHAEAYLSSLRRLKRQRPTCRDKSLVTVYAAPDQENGDGEIVLRPGAVLGVDSPGLRSLDKVAVGNILKALGIESPPGVAFVSSDPHASFMKIRSLLPQMRPHIEELQGGMACLDEAELRGVLSAVRAEFDESKWAMLGGFPKLVLQLHLQGPPGLVLVDQRAVSALTDAQKNDVRALLAGSICIVVYGSSQQPTVFGEARILLDGKGGTEVDDYEDDDPFLAGDL